MLELLDLRERGERLDATRLEIDPTVADTVRGILQRVFVEGDEVLIELRAAVRRRRSSAGGRARDRRGVRRGERKTPTRAARGARRPDRPAPRPGRPAAPPPVVGRARRRAVRRDRPAARSRSGCYVPGGRAVYPSIVCMTVVPAVVAGVDEIVLCTPPQIRRLDPASVLYAARRAGAHFVAKTGGAQAVAAMAYGTETDPEGRPDRRARATPTSPRRSARSRGPSASTGSPDRRSSRSSPTATSTPTWRRSTSSRRPSTTPRRARSSSRPTPTWSDRVAKALDEALEDAGRREIVDAALDTRRPCSSATSTRRPRS